MRNSLFNHTNFFPFCLTILLAGKLAAEPASYPSPQQYSILWQDYDRTDWTDRPNACLKAFEFRNDSGWVTRYSYYTHFEGTERKVSDHMQLYGHLVAQRNRFIDLSQAKVREDVKAKHPKILLRDVIYLSARANNSVAQALLMFANHLSPFEPMRDMFEDAATEFTTDSANSSSTQYRAYAKEWHLAGEKIFDPSNPQHTASIYAAGAGHARLVFEKVLVTFFVPNLQDTNVSVAFFDREKRLPSNVRQRLENAVIDVIFDDGTARSLGKVFYAEDPLGVEHTGFADIVAELMDLKALAAAYSLADSQAKRGEDRVYLIAMSGFTAEAKNHLEARGVHTMGQYPSRTRRVEYSWDEFTKLQRKEGR